MCFSTRPCPEEEEEEEEGEKEEEEEQGLGGSHDLLPDMRRPDCFRTAPLEVPTLSPGPVLHPESLFDGPEARRGPPEAENWQQPRVWATESWHSGQARAAPARAASAVAAPAPRATAPPGRARAAAMGAPDARRAGGRQRRPITSNALRQARVVSLQLCMY
ncbi:unnamed protein product, partial [Prorocentrum cordatum]